MKLRLAYELESSLTSHEACLATVPHSRTLLWCWKHVTSAQAKVADVEISAEEIKGVKAAINTHETTITLAEGSPFLLPILCSIQFFQSSYWREIDNYVFDWELTSVFNQWSGSSSHYAFMLLYKMFWSCKCWMRHLDWMIKLCLSSVTYFSRGVSHWKTCVPSRGILYRKVQESSRHRSITFLYCPTCYTRRLRQSTESFLVSSTNTHLSIQVKYSLQQNLVSLVHILWHPSRDSFESNTFQVIIPCRDTIYIDIEILLYVQSCAQTWMHSFSLLNTLPTISCLRHNKGSSR